MSIASLPTLPRSTVETLTTIGQVTLSIGVQFAVWIMLWQLSKSMFDGFIDFLAGYGLVAIASVTIPALAIAVGLPIRLVPRVKGWWVARRWITPLGCAIAASLIAAGVFTGHLTWDHVGDDSIRIVVFNWAFIWPGLALLAFFMTHFWLAPREEDEPGSSRGVQG